MSSEKKGENKELTSEIKKIVSDNLRNMLTTALPSIVSGRTLRGIELGDVTVGSDYRDTYREGGGHKDKYSDYYSEEGYKDHYSDSRDGSIVFQPEEITREELIREIDRLRSKLEGIKVSR